MRILIIVALGLALGACQTDAGAKRDRDLPEFATLVDDGVRPIGEPLLLAYGPYAEAQLRGQMGGTYRAGRQTVPMSCEWRGSSSMAAVGDLLAMTTDVDRMSLVVDGRPLLPADAGYAVQLLMSPQGEVRHVTTKFFADGRWMEATAEQARSLTTIVRQAAVRFPAAGIRTGDRLPVALDGLFGAGSAFDGSLVVEGLAQYRGRDVVVFSGGGVVTIPAGNLPEADLSVAWISLLDRGTAMPLYEVGTLRGRIERVRADLSFTRELVF